MTPGQLKTLNPNGTAPDSRLSDAASAKQMYTRISNVYYAGPGRINAKVQGSINGNPPVLQSTLDAEGLGWMSNVNFRLLEGDVNSAQVPFYMVFADVPQYAQIKVKDPAYQALDNARFGEIISEEHTQLNNDWRYFDHNMQLSIANMVTYGSGPIYFTDKKDFRFEAAPQGTVFVPQETSQNLDKLPLLYFYYEWEMTELFRMIERPGAEKAGWNVNNIKTLLTNACNEYAGSGKIRSWEFWQQRLREDDIYLSQIVPTIKTAWGYVKEFDGKISRFLITANQADLGDKSKIEFLYRKDKEYDNWDQIIHPFFVEKANGNWRGVKGIGIKAYNFRDAQNRLKNRVLDAAFLGSQVLLQAQDAKTAEDMQLMQMGPMAILPPGVTFNQMPLLSTLDKPMAVDRALEVDLQRNIGGIRQNMVDPQSSQPISATEANINATYTGQLSQGQLTHYMRQLDWLYKEQVRRLSEKPRSESDVYPYEDWEKMHAEFRSRCRERGVPDSAFKHIISVKATRSMGRGSEYFKQKIGSQIYGILMNDPNVPQGVRVRHLRHLLSNLSGQDYLQTIWPEAEIESSPTDDESKAQDENAGMLLGVPPIWTPEQDNLAHAATHLQFLSQNLQAVLQGQADPAAHLKLAGVALPHIQETLQALSERKAYGKLYQTLFNEMQQLQAKTQQIQQQYEQAQQAQQQQQAEAQRQMMEAQQTGQLRDPESQVKLAKVQANAAIKDREVQASIARKNAIAQADIALKGATTRQNLALNDLNAAQDIVLNQTKNAQKQTDSAGR